jgi:hypothetical protein
MAFRGVFLILIQISISNNVQRVYFVEARDATLTCHCYILNSARFNEIISGWSNTRKYKIIGAKL